MNKLRESEHRRRSEDHRSAGDRRYPADDEWAAVAWFYSAYHLIRATFLRDPIWDDLAALKAINQGLIPDDRFTERHKGRRRPGSQEWGVNDLVLMLYRPVASDYNTLHQGSLSVRYGTGLPHGSLPQYRDALGRLRGQSGRLYAPLSAT